MKTASTKSARTMASQVGGLCGGCVRTTRRRQGSAGGRTRVDIVGLTSKPEVSHVVQRRGRGFDRFGLKTGSGLGVVKVRAESTWRHREACVEAKRSREDSMSVRCFYKKLGEFAPVWTVIIINSVGVFLSSGGDLEDKKRRMDSHPIWLTRSRRPLLLPLFSLLPFFT